MSGWNTFLPWTIITGEKSWALWTCSKWDHLLTCSILLEGFCFLFYNFSSEFSGHILERTLGLSIISVFALLFLPLRCFRTSSFAHSFLFLEETRFDCIYDQNFVVSVLQNAQSIRILFGPLYALIVQKIEGIVKVTISALPELILTGSNVCHLPTHIM